MGQSNSAARRRNTTVSAGPVIPTLKFRRAIKGPNIQQDEEISWTLQIWRDDSFMFKQQSTVRVPQRFHERHAPAKTEVVQEMTYYGSSGSVVITDDKGFILPDSRQGTGFKHLFTLHAAELERKKARGSAEMPMSLTRSTFFTFRTQRMEFKKRHQRPSHLHDSADIPRRKSYIVPETGLLVTADQPEPKPIGRGSSSQPVLPAGFRSDTSDQPLMSLPDLDDAEFDWEWECDGIIDEVQYPLAPIKNILPARILDMIAQYAIPKDSLITVAPSHPLNVLASQSPANSPVAETKSADFSPRSENEVSVYVPDAAIESEVRKKKKNPTDPDFLASPGTLRITAEFGPRVESAKVTFLPVVIKPAPDKKGGHLIDPDIDGNINFIKEPLPEPVALPVLELSKANTLDLKNIP